MGVIVGVIVVVDVVLVVLAVLWVRAWWHGPPYPVGDPRATAGELRATSQTVYTAVEGTEPVHGLVDPSSCPERGGQAIDGGSEPGVFDLDFSWEMDMGGEPVHDVLREGRDALLDHGWRVVMEGISSPQAGSFGLERGDRFVSLVAVTNNAGTRLSVRVSSSCAALPEDYDGPSLENQLTFEDLGLAPLGT
ncbi:hypothetical protein [Streptomyces sp. B6B3]|uniref:hypothetical protein n=1 Tax=Streptomyces sp. B6B3 TaxID=3153570 RepID=UPI00325F3CE0